MRYYLDTNCLVGYTFFHDWWHSDAKRLFNSDNDLYIGDTVLFEYCNMDVASDEYEEPYPREELSWSEEQGNFKSKLVKLWDRRFFFEDKLLEHEDDLDLETAVEVFMNAYKIRPDSEPAIQQYFEEKLDQLDLDITVKNVRKVQKMLVQDLERFGREKKKEIRRKVKLGPERDDIPDSRYETLDRVLSDSNDVEMVCDASYMCDEGLLARLVTGDKGNAFRDTDGNVVRDGGGNPVDGKVGVYNSREVIKTVSDLKVLYLRDEFA